MWVLQHVQFERNPGNDDNYDDNISSKRVPFMMWRHDMEVRSAILFFHVFFAVSLDTLFEESTFRDTNPLILIWRHYTAKLVGFPVVIRCLLTATLPFPAFCLHSQTILIIIMLYGTSKNEMAYKWLS